MHFSILYNPKHLSLTNIPKNVAETVLKKLTTSGFNTRYQRYIEPVIQELKNAKLVTNQPFINYIKNLDKIRNESFEQVLPELSVAFY